jgi:hypothetical protein
MSGVIFWAIFYLVAFAEARISLQVSLSQLQVDFYPYHLAAGDRAAWIRYQVPILPKVTNICNYKYL